jgi:hypothetical protein
MSSAGSNRDPTGDRPYADPASASRGHRSAHSALLDKVLQETLAMASADAPVPPEDRNALIEVARRHATTEVTLDAVVELIQIVLKSRFCSIAEDPQYFSKMSREIAVTVRDDPRTWDRVQSFWARLCEAAR